MASCPVSAIEPKQGKAHAVSSTVMPQVAPASDERRNGGPEYLRPVQSTIAWLTSELMTNRYFAR